MSERRVWERFDPDSVEEDVILHFNGHQIPGIAGNISQGGICVIVMGNPDLPIGAEVKLTYRQREITVVVRNVTNDPATTAYGMEWTGGPVPALLD